MSHNSYINHLRLLGVTLLVTLGAIFTTSAQEQVVTIQTTLSVGDSVYLKVVAKEAAVVTATGLSASVLEQDWKKYALTDQTFSITGPVLYLATFKNGVTEINFENALHLDRIDCEENQLTKLNCNAAPNLTMIFCHKNQLQELDISECSRLTWVNCSENQLSSIDLTNKPVLKQFVCSNNPLTTLDPSGAPALRSLDCAFCGLTSLDLSANKRLQGVNCGYNQLTELVTTGCSALTAIYCERNKLQTLDLSTLSALQVLKCYLNEITALDFAACTAAYTLYIENNKIGKTEMLALAHSLPMRDADAEQPAQIAVYDASYPLEENLCNKDAVQTAKAKNWQVLHYTKNRKYEPYEGADATAIEAIWRTDKPIVYPSVASSTLHLTDPTVSHITCYTMTGELLLSIDQPGSSIDVSTLSEGHYLIQAGDQCSHIEIRR